MGNEAAIFASIIAFVVKLAEGFGVPIEDIIAEMSKNPTASGKKTAEALAKINANMPEGD